MNTALKREAYPEGVRAPLAFCGGKHQTEKHFHSLNRIKTSAWAD